jgi:tripartite-type tricarboxylate transporter receptor subunit TctC
MATPEVREQMDRQGNVIQPTTPEAAVQYFRSEQDRYAKIVRKTEIKVD